MPSFVLEHFVRGACSDTIDVTGTCFCTVADSWKNTMRAALTCFVPPDLLLQYARQL